MRALQLEKLPEWHMEDFNVEWEIDQPDLLKLNKSSSISSDSSVILLADSRELNPFGEPKISRLSKDGWSDISDAILDNFLKGQSSRPSLDREKELTMRISESSIKVCAPDLESWKANELYTPSWKNAKNQIVRVHPEESWRDLLKVDVPKIKLEPAVSYGQEKKRVSSPIDLFDLDKVFDKVESMHSDSWVSDSPSRGHCSNISETSDSLYSHAMGRVRELEALLANVWDTLETVSDKNKKLQEEKKRIEVDAATTAENFQKTIDQLVAEVVRLEDESEEKKTLLAYIWEESQVAQEAAKDRRKMLTCLRRDNTDLRVKLSRLQMLYDKMLNTNMTEMKKEKTVDLMTTVTNFAGVIPGSPIVDQKVRRMSKWDSEQLPASSEILKEDKLILKPESDINEFRLSKCTELGLGEDTFFRVTIEEISPEYNSIVVSFDITNHNEEISDLITKFREIGSRQPKRNSNENEWNSPQKSEIDGFGEEVKVQSSTPYIPTLSSFESYQTANGRSRSRSLSKLQEVLTRSPRSWSASPKRSVCKSLLQSLERSLSPSSLKVHDRRQNLLTNKIKNDASDVVRRLLSNQNPPSLDDQIPTHSPISKVCEVAAGSCNTIQQNTNSVHDSHGDINLQGDVEQNYSIVHPLLDHLPSSRRASNEWKEISADGSKGLNMLESHKSNNKLDNRLSVQPQSCISFASCDSKIREIKRHLKGKKRRKKKSKKKVGVGMFDYEIKMRSPSFKFVV